MIEQSTDTGLEAARAPEGSTLGFSGHFMQLGATALLFLSLANASMFRRHTEFTDVTSDNRPIAGASPEGTHVLNTPMFTDQS